MNKNKPTKEIILKLGEECHKIGGYICKFCEEDRDTESIGCECDCHPKSKPTKEYVCENCGVEVDSKGIEIKNPTDPFMHNPILKEHKHKWVKYFEKGGQIGRGWIYLCECGDTKPFKPTKECKHKNRFYGFSLKELQNDMDYQELENKALEEFDKDYYRLEWHTPEEIKDFLKSHLQLAYKAGEEKERENRWSGISPNVLENILNDTRKKAIDDYNKRIKKWVEKN